MTFPLSLLYTSLTFLVAEGREDIGRDGETGNRGGGERRRGSEREREREGERERIGEMGEVRGERREGVGGRE